MHRTSYHTHPDLPIIPPLLPKITTPNKNTLLRENFLSTVDSSMRKEASAPCNDKSGIVSPFGRSLNDRFDVVKALSLRLAGRPSQRLVGSIALPTPEHRIVRVEHILSSPVLLLSIPWIVPARAHAIPRNRHSLAQPHLACRP